ncbi:hypothetical protein [Chamaesiphon minutus]|uniref:Uncharacterized protein n=1 Tax=Chamaesiphon minutus (strain ATCC 27169 / PCC 6605) TaxID=1173020 RepID=K9UFN8_CHAP6|nr:hypothetical protein [Chamaesiphon minutus]AFY93468.1 hypothetical protein Cha6605_2408 [Chamaesiphon minutus PCC 6605]
MTPAEQPHNPGSANSGDSRAKTDQAIETIYTTVEAQPDRTDWLTVVSNLRQINRHLVEEIARLEQALASAKQTLHTHKEANQSHEITILQQQDELRTAHDRVSALFLQLETSHQIGQRQQTLIETLSQQLEIVQTIVPQIEAEHEELRQQYDLQSQKLLKTERVAIELHRRLKLLQANGTSQSTPGSTATPPQSDATDPTPFSGELSGEIATYKSTADRSAPKRTDISTAKIDPAPPSAPLAAPQIEMPDWTPSAPNRAKNTILPPPQPSSPGGWREVIRQDRETHPYRDLYQPAPAPVAADTSLSTETSDKESTAFNDLKIAESSPNWPAPTVNRGTVAKATKIDLPKFPKRAEN